MFKITILFLSHNTYLVYEKTVNNNNIIVQISPLVFIYNLKLELENMHFYEWKFIFHK